MKTGLFIIPFIALFIGALGTTIGSSYTEISWFSTLGWSSAAALLVLWFILDLDGFKAFFSRKGTKYGASSGMVVILGIAVIVGISILTSLPRLNKTIDATRDKLNTLSDQSIKVIATLEEKNAPITVEAFFTDEQVELQFRDLSALYLAEGANLNIEYIDPQTDPTRALASKLTSGNTVILKLESRENRITTFNEEKLTNSIIQVLKEKSKKIYFTKGHGEGQIEGGEAVGYQLVTKELTANKTEVSELSLLETTKVPDDADAVVIGGPKYDFKEKEIEFLEAYINSGGSLLVMVDAMTPTVRLNSLLKKYGIKIRQDFLILNPQDPRAQLLGQNSTIVSEFDDFNPVSRDFAKQSQVALLLQNTRSLEAIEENEAKTKVTLAGKTSDVMVRVKNVASASDLQGLTEDRIEVGSFPVIAVAAGKTKEGAEIRIVVAGSAQLANNNGARSEENRDMFLNMVSYLMQDEDFISIRPKDPTKSTLNLTSSSSQLILLFLAFIYPFFFLGGGTFYWLRRRKA